MNQKLRKSRTMLGLVFTFLMLIPITGKSQGVQQTVSSKRVKDNFDGSWLFHKRDIAIKRNIKSGGYGGLTDANVKVVTGEEAVIVYL